MEMESARVFVEFTMTGLLIDHDYLEKIGQAWTKEEDDLTAEMRKQVGDPEFNPGSPKQLAEYLYDVLELAPFGGREWLEKDKIDENVISSCIQTVNDDPEAREYWTSRRTVMSSGMKGFGG